MTTLKVYSTLFASSDKYTVTVQVFGLSDYVTPASFGLILISLGEFKSMKDGTSVPREMVTEEESGSLVAGSV
jgi:hypothetical protein